MRLLAITPIHVDEAEIARRRDRYQRLVPEGVTVHLEDLGTGSEVPRALESAEDVTASEEALLRRYREADLAEVDGLLPDCVLDPVIEHAEAFPVPVFGIGKLTAHHLAGFGGRLGGVARNSAIANELDRKLGSYGIEPATPTAVLDLTVEDIADDATWASAVDRTVHALPCDYVINACSAVDLVHRDSGPRLVDPTWTALQLIGLLVTVDGAR